MQLAFKDDFAATQQNWEAFWRGELGRPAVLATVSRQNIPPADNPGWYSLMPGTDPGPAIDRIVAWAETHDFIAEAIPAYYLEFAADHFAALLGADLEFPDSQGGGWAVPHIDELASCDIQFDRDGRWWRETVELAETLKDAARGKMLIIGPSLVANLDALAGVHGIEKLFMSMVDQPDAVHRALEQIDRAHAEIFKALSELLDYPTNGTITRHGMYSTGLAGILQSDISCMLSPDMFNEFVLPHLANEAAPFDHVTYHLDGPGAIPHLEPLADQDWIDIIQWVPGAGEAQQQDWSQIYAQIDSLGKGTIRRGDPATLQEYWRASTDPLQVYQLSAQTRMGGKPFQKSV